MNLQAAAFAAAAVEGADGAAHGRSEDCTVEDFFRSRRGGRSLRSESADLLIAYNAARGTTVGELETTRPWYQKLQMIGFQFADTR